VSENTSLEDDATVAVSTSDPVPEPVFVDDTGKRRRRIRIAFYALGGVSLTYAGLVAVSLLGGPLNPESLIPFPQTFNRPAADTSAPITAEAARLANRTPRPGISRPAEGTSGYPTPANPAKPIVAPPASPGTVPTATPTETPTPEATPTPTPPPGPTPPTTTPGPSTTTSTSAPDPGGQGGGQGGQGGPPEDTSTGTADPAPIQTTTVAAPNPVDVPSNATSQSSGTTSDLAPSESAVTGSAAQL
jgi:hypothetical protein